MLLPQFTNVTLLKAYDKDGLSLPAGASGTIVDVYPQFGCYMVEFFEPIQCVEALPTELVAKDLTLV